MSIIAVTGKIGSGKSTVCSLFKAKGAKVVNADKIARQLLEPTGVAYPSVVDYFGGGILMNNRQINRATLKKTIFSNPKAKHWLENLLHPIIREKIQLEAQHHHSHPYCLIEIPLLKHAQDYPYVNAILYVNAAYETRLSRTLKRDNISLKTFDDINASQEFLTHFEKTAAFVINNDGNDDQLEDSVNQIHQQLLWISYKN